MASHLCCTHTLHLVLGLGFVLGACDRSQASAAPEPSPVSDETPASSSPDATPDPEPDAGHGSEVGGEEAAPSSAPEVIAQDVPPQTSSRSTAPEPLPSPRFKKIDASCGRDAGVGQDLKAFRLPSLDGKTVDHHSYRNRVLLVNFWGTWCKPCLEELPEFDQLYRRYRKHGLTLVAIATDAEPQPVEEFVQRRKLGAKVLIAGESYALEYNQAKFPFTFIVDPAGKIVASYSGFRQECMGKLEADIRAQLDLRNKGSSL